MVRTAILDDSAFHLYLHWTERLLFPTEDVAAGSLPLVNISASVSLSAADMTMYLKKMSRGEAVEGKNPL